MKIPIERLDGICIIPMQRTEEEDQERDEGYSSSIKIKCIRLLAHCAGTQSVEMDWCHAVNDDVEHWVVITDWQQTGSFTAWPC